jgi:hypothetical protein
VVFIPHLSGDTVGEHRKRPVVLADALFDDASVLFPYMETTGTATSKKKNMAATTVFSPLSYLVTDNNSSMLIIFTQKQFR